MPGGGNQTAAWGIARPFSCFVKAPESAFLSTAVHYSTSVSKTSKIEYNMLFTLEQWLPQTVANPQQTRNLVARNGCLAMFCL